MIHDDENGYSANARVIPQKCRVFVLAASYVAASNFATEVGLRNWIYCSYMEQLGGLRDCVVHLAPGWRSRGYVKNWLAHFKLRNFELIASKGDTILLEMPLATLTKESPYPRLTACWSGPCNISKVDNAKY